MALYMGTSPFTVMGIEGRKNIGSAGTLTEIGKVTQLGTDGNQSIVLLFDFKFMADSAYSIKYEHWRVSLTKYTTWAGIASTPVGEEVGVTRSSSSGHNNIANATMSVDIDSTSFWEINVGADMTGSGGYDVWLDWRLQMMSNFAYPTWTST